MELHAADGSGTGWLAAGVSGHPPGKPAQRLLLLPGSVWAEDPGPWRRCSAAAGPGVYKKVWGVGAELELHSWLVERALGGLAAASTAEPAAGGSGWCSIEAAWRRAKEWEGPQGRARSRELDPGPPSSCTADRGTPPKPPPGSDPWHQDCGWVAAAWRARRATVSGEGCSRACPLPAWSPAALRELEACAAVSCCPLSLPWPSMSQSEDDAWCCKPGRLLLIPALEPDALP